MRFVTIKTIAPQDLQAIHRIRSELVRQRTAKVKQVRGLLAEYGLVVDRQVTTLRRALPELLENAAIGLSFDFRGLLEDLQQDLIRLDERVAEMDKKVHTLANSMPAAKRLQSIPGIGPISATAILCAVGGWQTVQARA